MGNFSHVEDDTATMVDVSNKDDVYREATAAGAIELQPSTIEALRDGDAIEENVFSTARIAAIQAVKRTWDDIPMCHQVPVSDISITFRFDDANIRARVTVVSTGKTGVEMEALNGVSRALLTVWDMVKAEEKDEAGQYPDAAIRDIRVEEKIKDDHDE